MNAAERTGNEMYMRAYMDGYTSAMERCERESEKPYLTVDDVMKRYGGISKNKAYGIMQSVRHYCNGGKLNNDRMILRAELEYWEKEVEKQYKERL